MIEPDRSAAQRGASNLTMTIAGQAVLLLLVTFTGFLIPRYMGVEKYGLFAASLAVVVMVQTISSFGLQQITVVYLPRLWRAEGKRPDAIKLGSSIWTLRLLFSIPAGVFAATWLSHSPKLALDLQLCFLLGALCLLVSADQGTYSFFLPLGHPGKAAAIDVLRACANLGTVVLLFQRWGLAGVFAGLVVINSALLLLDIIMLLHIIPIRPTTASVSVLRPFKRFTLSSYLAQISSVTYSHLTVYVVATWVASHEAGILAIAVQLYALSRSFFQAARRSLMPILTELENANDTRRLANWGSMVIRYGVAASTILVGTWCFVGEEVVRALLTDTFTPVHSVAAVILIGVVFSCCGASCDGLLYIRGLAGAAAINTILNAAVAVIALCVVALDGRPGAAYRIAWVYVASAALFALSTYVTLGRLGKIWLPIGRATFLVMPVALALPAVGWNVGLATKVATLIVFLLSYASMALVLGLLPAHETREIFIAIKRWKNIRASGTETFEGARN